MPPPNPEEWMDAGMDTDASPGHPAKWTPEKGIKEMRDRIILLRRRLENVGDNPDEVGVVDFADQPDLLYSPRMGRFRGRRG